MTMERETRTLAASLELRADAYGKVVVEGYAAVFNEPTNIGDAFVEVIAPGAFRGAIERKDDVEFLVNHGGLPLARTTAGNLRLREDDRGLHIRAVLDPEDPDVQRLVPKMRGKMIDQMSFAFQATRQQWDEGSDDLPRRTVQDVILYDVSAVNRGAYPQTSIALRSLEQHRASEQEAEQERERIAKLEREAKRACIAARKAKQEQKFRRICD